MAAKRQPRKGGPRAAIPSLAPTPDGWPSPSAVAAGFDSRALAAHVVEGLDADELFGHLEAIPPAARATILRRHRLSAAVTVQRPMVEHLRSLLRKSPDGELVADLAWPVHALLSRIELPEKNWAVLFGTEPRAALELMAKHPRLLDLLAVAEQTPDALNTMGLCAAINSGASLSALALALLAVEHEEAGLAYETVSTGFPAVPRVPLRAALPGERLRSLGYGPVHGQRLTVETIRHLLMDTPESETAPAPKTLRDRDAADAQDGSIDGSTLENRLEAAVRSWRTAADACRGSLEALESGLLPEAGGLGIVESLVDDVEALAAEAAEALGGPVAPSSADLTLAAERIRVARQEADGDWLRELAGIVVPEHLSMLVPAADEVRRIVGGLLAGATVTGDVTREALRALHRLLTIGIAVTEGNSADVADVPGLQRTATANLPEEVHLLVTLANSGQVRFGASGPEPAASLGQSSDTAVDESAAGGGEPDVLDVSPVDLSDLDEMLAGPMATGFGRDRGRTQTPATVRSEPAPAAPSGPRPNKRILGSADLAEADRLLLAEGRFGLAADLCEAAGMPEASVAARRLGALAVELRTDVGEIAAAFAVEAENVKGLADDRAGQLVAWASAVRVAVLAPSIGAAGLIADFESCVTGYRGLLALGSAFADASRAGLVVAPAVSATVSTIAEAERAASTRARQAADLTRNASLRNIKYIPANAVYQAWMAPDGILGGLLADAESDDFERAESVRLRILALRVRGQVDEEIDTTFAEQRKQVPSRTKIIIAGARTTLRQRYDEALDAAQAWTDAVARVGEARAHGRAAEGWQARPYERLRELIHAVEAQVRSELASPGAVESGWPAIVGMIQEAMRIADGNPPTGRESTVPLALHSEFLGSDLPLTFPDLLPEGGLGTETIHVLTALAAEPRQSPSQMYQRRDAAGEHDLTDQVIRWARSRDEDLADDLAGRRVDSVRSGQADAERQVADLVKKLNVARMAGTLDEQVWSGMAARADALRVDRSNNFRRVLEQTRKLAAEADAWRERKVAAFVADLDEQAAENAKVAEQREMLYHMAAAGNLASAEELREQISAGRVLPLENVGDDSFSDFFPAVPEYAAGHHGLIGDLRDLLRGGSGRAEAASRLAAVGLVPAGLGSDRAKRAEVAARSWMDLQAGGSKVVDDTFLLRAVLGEAGLEFDKSVRQGTEAGRVWYRLSGVKGTGEALTPELGSLMSPGGSTLRVLLVRKAQTPATLIEWLRSEPADQTVLVLWLTGTALSTKDRRAIGDAAKARPKPAVLVLDEAALAFLACRPEPRRSTFEALARPFTAASPYADTPGDTPPEMFYGRLEELDAVMDFRGPSIFYGGRQLGKSALLRMAQRRFERGPNNRAVLASIFTVGQDRDPEKLWSDLWPKLAEIGVVGEPRPTGDLAELTYEAIVSWTRKDENRSLLVMLDEADAFLEADAADNKFVHVDWWRKIRDDTGRRVKVVFAGLHRTARFDSLMNHPLGHLLPPVLVGPLRPQPAHDLLVRPLAALGYRFADPVATPARVLAQANNMPALLQLFGAALVAHLSTRPAPIDRPWTLITDDDVDAVFASADLSERFRGKYVMTLNLDHRYMVIAYLVALAAYDRGLGTSMTLQELYDRSVETWPAGFADCRFDDFRGLVDECIDLGVLASDSGRYRMRTPTVQRLLGTDIQLMETLTDADAILVPPARRDVASYRRPLIRAGGGRMPLTERQWGEVYRGHAEPLRGPSRVLVVSGSAQLGVDRVLESLEQVDRDRVQRLALLRLAGRDTRSLHAQLRAAGGPTLAVADLRAASVGETREYLATARQAAAELSRTTVAVLVTPATAPAWIGHDVRVDLSRIDGSGLRFWAEDDLPNLPDEASRAAVLRATGGWPLLLEEHVRGVAAAAAMPGPAAARFIESVGMAAAPDGNAVAAALTAVFRTVAEVTDGRGDYEDEIRAALEAWDDLVDLAVEAGFDDVGQVLDTLLALDCFHRCQDGRIRPERVLAAALGRLEAA